LDKPPLYVDLDGTLIRTDTMQQAVLMLLRHRPLTALWAIAFIATHRVKVKNVVAELIVLDAAHLPYREEVVEYVRRAKSGGRRVVLATGSAMRYAGAAARHVGLFDAVFATERDGLNLISANKLAKIREDAKAHGYDKFEYLGDSHADVMIFRESAVAGWVGGRKLKVEAGEGTHIHRLADLRNDRWADQLRLLRPTWWLVAPVLCLIFLAMTTTPSAAAWGPALLASVGASCALVAGFILGDLLHIAVDQHAARRPSGPVASGAVTIRRAVIWLMIAIVAAVGLGLAVSIKTAVGLILSVLLIQLFIWRSPPRDVSPAMPANDSNANA
jgi:phosphoserine phosphatase